ncbi:heterokaryon incompatibility [Zalerion maritima]|uniref:Heterokaryon incompatibility n=1 Tax=Zalerion maritima TaxID=339359 RepID=A0AAD5WNK2_9PEZI|nr:heterokaryon incompatibility [Zalerion maritima]
MWPKGRSIECLDSFHSTPFGTPPASSSSTIEFLLTTLDAKMGPQAYDYADKPLHGGQIRLLSLQKPAGDSPGAWSLEITTLREAREPYVALSYTWGMPLNEPPFDSMTADRCHEFGCGGKSVLVTANLLSFLKHAEADRKLARNKFWIDAICINQVDLEERAAQISMMAKIYESAEYVLAWLGEADREPLLTGRAFRFLNRLAAGEVMPPIQSNAAAAAADISDSQASIKLFQRTYWSRAWIIQELVLAKKAIVRCGEHEADFGVFANASHHLATGTWGEVFNHRRHQLRRQVPQSVAGAHIAELYCIPAALKATKDCLGTEHWTNILLYSLIRSRNFESTLPEDKIYSLLGLIEGSVNVGAMPLLRPNYANPDAAAKAYLNLALLLLRESYDLLVLTCVEGQSFQPLRATTSIPSWVPDWSCRRPLGLRVTGYKRYSADACFDPPDGPASPAQKLLRWPVEIRGTGFRSILGLRAFEVDRVSLVGEAKHEVRQGKPFPSLLAILESLPPRYHATGEDKLEALWRTLIGNTAGQERAAPDSSPLDRGFARWLRDAVDEAAGGLDAEWSRRKASFARFCQNNLSWCELSGGDDAALAYYASTFSHGKHLRPFLTARKYLGLGTENVKEGDKVFLVPRCVIPLIFRPLAKPGDGEEDDYELVGGSYLHGFMDGKAATGIAALGGFQLIDKLRTIIVH